MKKNLPLFAALAASLSVGSIYAASPYISNVYEYRPAPGQFVNELPEYEPGDTEADMVAKAAEQLVGERMPGMITLGAWGGYVVFGFDHDLYNKPADYDFKIYGNALISDRDNRGGSSEPGIVMVSEDVNGNGLPDDPWYELAGSEYSKETTLKNYRLTYHTPAADHVADPDPDYKYITDRTYIRWESNNTDQPSGYVMRNSYHSQSYWPEWLDAQTLEFDGTKLADNYIDLNGDGTYFVQLFSDWGYADNLPNTEDKGFNIEWAVDADGNPVKLDKINFVKVYTGVNQYCGWLGESSTEVAGAEDLHPDWTPTALDGVASDELLTLLSARGGNLLVRTSADTLPYSIYTLSGAEAARGILTRGDNSINTTLPRGIYMLQAGGHTLKFVF